MRRLVSCLVVVAALVGSVAAPASATDAAAGDVALSGTVTLPTYPCPPPPPFGSGPCTGSFAADWAGHLAGTAGAAVYDLTWATSSGSAMTGSVTYSALNCDELGARFGLGLGTASATVGANDVHGTWQVVGGPAHDVIGVSASFSYDWGTVATASITVLDPFTLTVDVDGLGSQTVVASKQTGVMAFAPPVVSGLDCDNPVTNVTAPLVGDVPLAG